MPGTIYTRKGPEQDPAGRLADFARFAVEEIDEIRRALNAPGNYELGAPVYRADRHVDAALRELGYVADLLVGYTTADDPVDEATSDGPTPSQREADVERYGHVAGWRKES